MNPFMFMHSKPKGPSKREGTREQVFKMAATTKGARSRNRTGPIGRMEAACLMFLDDVTYGSQGTEDDVEMKEYYG